MRKFYKALALVAWCEDYEASIPKRNLDYICREEMASNTCNMREELRWYTGTQHIKGTVIKALLSEAYAYRIGMFAIHTFA